MATQKPISSISYNTESFLKEKLITWLENHLIQSYMYIKHKGEDGDKDHIHFRIEPNKRLDPMDLKEELKEFTPENDKPLGCRPFRPSQEEDWILYVVHDPKYLQLKYNSGEKGEKIPYSWEDIVAPEDYDVEVAFIRAKSKLEHTSGNIASRLQSGADPVHLIACGENPYLVNAVSSALKNSDYFRISTRLDSLVTSLEGFGIDVYFDDNQAVLDFGNFSIRNLYERIPKK